MLPQPWTGRLNFPPPPPPLPFLFDKKVVVPQNVIVRERIGHTDHSIGMADALSDYSHRRHLQHVMVRVIGMADALSDYSHRRHLQSHTMDGQSRIGGS